VDVELEQRFKAPLQDVASAYADPAIFEHLVGLEGLSQPELLEHVDDGKRLRQRVRYAFIGSLSPAVTSVIDQRRLTWVEESTLDHDSNRRDFRIVADHYGDWFTCSGTVDLEDRGAVTVRRTRAQLEVSAPLIGATIEKAILAGLHDFSTSEAKRVQQWLDGRAVARNSPYTGSSSEPVWSGEDRTGPSRVSSMSDARSSENASETQPAPDTSRPRAEGEGEDPPLRDLLHTLGAQWGHVMEGLVGLLSEQVSKNMGELTTQWHSMTSGYSAQLAQQWAQVQDALNTQLRNSPQITSSLKQLGDTIAGSGESRNEQLAELSATLNGELGSITAQLNSALHEMTRQLNAELVQATAAFRPHVTYGHPQEQTENTEPEN
jgi:hypothetical protein